MKVGPVPAWLVMAGGAVVVGVTGLVLVLSAPFDDSARSGLGSGLITGMIVGLALAAIQWTVERYEEASNERRHATMQQIALSRLAALVAAHIWNCWNLLLPYVDSRPPLVTDDPQGYSPDDLRNTQRALQWLREKMGTDPPWWRDPSLRATADALSFVSTDLVERMGFPSRLGPESLSGIEQSFQSVERVRQGTVERLVGIGDRLAAGGDIDRAFTLDTQADALQSDTAMSIHAPDLGEFRTGEGVISFGPRALADVRSEVGWLGDQLRPDPVIVNEYGVPTSPGAPHPVVYRWGPLLGTGDDPSTAWEQRFAVGSWLRRIFETSAEELPAMFGIESSGRRDSNE